MMRKKIQSRRGDSHSRSEIERSAGEACPVARDGRRIDEERNEGEGGGREAAQDVFLVVLAASLQLNSLGLVGGGRTV